MSPMRAMRQYRAIWLATTMRREGGAGFVRGAAWCLGLGGCLVGVGLAYARQWADPTLLPRVLLGAAASWLGLLWMVFYLPVSQVLHAGANARLLPRQRRRLVEMAAAGWLLASVGMGLALADWHGAALAGAFLLSFALVVAGRAYALFVLIVAGNWPWLSRTVVPGALVDALQTPAGQGVLVAALLALAAQGLRWLYPAGRDAYVERQARRTGRGALAQRLLHAGRKPRCAPFGNRQAYLAALRRDCRKADPAAMLMHALGPVAHWSAWIAGVAALLGLGLLARLVLAWSGVGPVRTLLEGVAGIGLTMQVLAIAFGTAQYGQLLRSHGGEQALLRLTPLAGDAALLNRRLAAQLLRRASLNWVLLTTAILATTLLIGAGPGVALRQVALCCLAGQLALVGLLGDYARDGGWTMKMACGAAALALLEGVAAAGIGWLNGTTPWPWLILLAASGGAVTAARGWCRMLAAPVAFPVGRMG